MIVVQCEFDGAIAEEDVGAALLGMFNPSGLDSPPGRKKALLPPARSSGWPRSTPMWPLTGNLSWTSCLASWWSDTTSTSS